MDISLVEAAFAFGGLGIGVAIGWVGCYLLQCRELQEQVLHMREKGFVAHFDEIDQQRQIHPAEGMIAREY